MPVHPRRRRLAGWTLLDTPAAPDPQLMHAATAPGLSCRTVDRHRRDRRERDARDLEHRGRSAHAIDVGGGRRARVRRRRGRLNGRLVRDGHSGQAAGREPPLRPRPHRNAGRVRRRDDPGRWRCGDRLELAAGGGGAPSAAVVGRRRGPGGCDRRARRHVGDQVPGSGGASAAPRSSPTPGTIPSTFLPR